MSILTRLRLENFALFRDFEWGDQAMLNVIIGENDTGKTHLLKLLYALSRGIEEYWKKTSGPQPLELAEVLSNKLRWTFLPQQFALKWLVSRGCDRLDIHLEWRRGGGLQLNFGKDTVHRIGECHSNALEAMRGPRATFLPPKEILTITDAIVATREGQEIAGFDDTYYDLVRDFRQPLTPGALQTNLQTAVGHLAQVTGGGEIQQDREGAIWFERNINGGRRERYNMAQTAEGIKKIGILSRLMRNRRLYPTEGSLLFVDEPEANLHPRAIVLFADMLDQFAQSGIQVYVATHSYFLLKRLEQLSRRRGADSVLLDLRKANGGVTATSYRLSEGLPANPIIEQSLRLFDDDLRLDLGLESEG